MKTRFLKTTRLLILLVSVFIVGCESDDEELFDDGGPGNPYGYWERGDGVNSYLEFTNTTAKACTNGTIQTGTFNPSAPSMTFVIGNDVLTFPLQFSNDQLLVGVPDQAINTNNATLYYRSTTFPCGGGGNNGGGNNGGGNSSTGNVMFWTSSDLGCGNISVSVANSSGIISQYYTSGSPDCGAGGCATFTLAPGNYSFTASCDGNSWNGSVTVTAGGCFKMRLTS